MIYRVPFRRGTEYRIGNPDGIFAHENFPESRCAVDFLVDLGTEVLAAAEGRVVRINRGSTTHFRPEELAGRSLDEIKALAAEYSNYVCIEHPNGTLTEYIHLGPEIPVNEGQEVERQLIGCTGLSGVMDIPHLHFNAFELIKGNPQSISVRFEDLNRG